MSKDSHCKRVSELLTECATRGLLLNVTVRSMVTGEFLDRDCDRHEAVMRHGDRIVMKHRRNREKITIWIV